MHIFLTTSFLTTSLILLKSAENGVNLSLSNLSTSGFSLAKSDFAATLDVSIPVVFLNQLFFPHN